MNEGLTSILTDRSGGASLASHSYVHSRKFALKSIRVALIEHRKAFRTG